MIVAATLLSNNYLVWWVAQLIALAIIVVLALRWKPGFLAGKTIGQTVTGTLDTRANGIKEQLELAERNRQEAERIRAQSQRDVEGARTEAEDIVTRAKATSEAIQRDIEARAQEEYDRIVGQAKTEIEYERRQAELALRRRAADIVIDGAEQIVERNLSAESDQRLIFDSVEQLGNGRSR
jgi:F-type H+-transporting ATPase subunit b